MQEIILGDIASEGPVQYGELGSEAEYSGDAEDQLFEGIYRHKHSDTSGCQACSRSNGSSNFICDDACQSTCSELYCGKGKLVPRKRLDAIIRSARASGSSSVTPAVHFGYIGCADQVMKSGEDRDSTARETGVITFEMEGARVWDMFPCLVIKAVGDYADGHKNKRWQNYAAVTAAAYTKAFLEQW
ncbi:hypothetical protein LY76DRAFT_647558 [Colletotrichum caudatum]|nr:hypothetical protein LY76DRAFT_647558 [Colletotrichum caudatum]